VSGSGSDRSGVAEWGVRLPHGVENDGELARHIDLRLLEAGSLSNPEPQAFREENGFGASECIGGFIEAGCRRASRCGYADLKVSRNTLCNGDDLACSIKATCDLRLPDLDAALACVVYAHSDRRRQRAPALSA